jgi:hypothetical protein
VKTTLRGVFLEDSEKYPKGRLGSEVQREVMSDELHSIQGENNSERITKTDLGTKGTQELSLYT